MLKISEHLSNQINQREKQIGELMNSIATEWAHVDPLKNQETSEKPLNYYSKILRKLPHQRGKFKFLEGGEDERGLAGPSAGFTGPEPQVLRVSHQAVAVVMLEEGTRIPGGSNPSGPGIRIQDKEVGHLKLVIQEIFHLNKQRVLVLHRYPAINLNQAIRLTKSLTSRATTSGPDQAADGSSQMKYQF